MDRLQGRAGGSAGGGRCINPAALHVVGRSGPGCALGAPTPRTVSGCAAPATPAPPRAAARRRPSAAASPPAGHGGRQGSGVRGMWHSRCSRGILHTLHNREPAPSCRTRHSQGGGPASPGGPARLCTGPRLRWGEGGGARASWLRQAAFAACTQGHAPARAHQRPLRSGGRSSRRSGSQPMTNEKTEKA